MLHSFDSGTIHLHMMRERKCDGWRIIASHIAWHLSCVHDRGMPWVLCGTAQQHLVLLACMWL